MRMLIGVCGTEKWFHSSHCSCESNENLFSAFHSRKVIGKTNDSTMWKVIVKSPLFCVSRRGEMNSRACLLSLSLSAILTVHLRNTRINLLQIVEGTEELYHILECCTYWDLLFLILNKDEPLRDHLFSGAGTLSCLEYILTMRWKNSISSTYFWIVSNSPLLKNRAKNPLFGLILISLFLISKHQV